MSALLDEILGAAKQIAQDSATSPLLGEWHDYDRAAAVALLTFDQDVPNVRIVHHTVSAAAFRFILAGSGALAGLTGADAWVRGRSVMQAVWHPYDVTIQGRAPLDEAMWVVRDEPSSITALELLGLTPSSGILRLEFTAPHALSKSSAADTTIRSGDLVAFETLCAAVILELYAARSVQNTGTSALQADSVNYQSESDVARRTAKMLRETYGRMVGRGTPDDLKAASAIGEMDVEASHGMGMLWHPKSRR